MNHQATRPVLNAKTQRRKGAKLGHPPLNAETQRRRDAEGCMPRLIARRGPGRRTARDRRTGGPLQPQAVVAAPRTADLRSVERRPRRYRSPSDIWWPCGSPIIKGRARRNRRAPGASAGGAFGRDKRLRLERTNVPPAVGDRSIAGCSTGNFRHCRIMSATTSLRLCAFAPLRSFAMAGVSASLRLCASALWPSVFPVRNGVSSLGLIGS